jgi:hypothetical protein
MDFVEYIQHPRDKFSSDVKKVDMSWAHKRYALCGAVIGLIFGIGIALVSGVLGAVLGAAAQNNVVFGIVAGLGMLAIIIMPILMAAVFVIGSYIGYGIMYFIAKLLGGTGSFEANYFLGAKLLVPVIIANIMVSILGMIPVLGVLINVAWFFYSIYLTIVLISVANKLSMGKSLIVMLVPFILALVLGFILAAGAIAAMIGASAI